MLKNVWLYLITTAAFLAIDFVWLSFVASRFYRSYLGSLMKDPANLPVALAFYLVYVVGILVFAVLPGAREGAVTAALWRGALLGLVAYGTYDLTNLATLKDWAWQVSAVDLAWGTVVTAAASGIGFFVARWLGVQ